MNEPATILFADDDPQIVEVVRVLLESEGYCVLTAEDGQQAVELALEGPDLIILDVVMPRMSGLEACMRIRAASNAPVLFLTAKSQDADKVSGFAAGGDDYLPKPFSSSELLARVKAMLRRYHDYGGVGEDPHSNVIRIGDLEIDMHSRHVSKKGASIALTDLEYETLLLLAKNRGAVLSAREIYENVWNDLYLTQSNNTVVVHIRNIRKKLGDDPQRPLYIRTVWGRGYTIG